MQSESEDSETERRKEEERKGEEEAKAAEKGKQRDGDKAPSEASTRGTNTPSGRASKHAAPPMQKSASSNSLKRPGSPNASDLSGNESSRKKQKLQLGNSASGRMSPAADRSRQPSFIQRRITGAGSGSDTDASVGGRKQKKPRVALSPNGTPGGSRAGSPDAPGGSRAGSPGAVAARKITGPLPTVEEIVPKLRPEGLTIPELLRMFKGRVPKDRSKDFIATVMKVARMDKETRIVYPRTKKAKEGVASPEAPAASGSGPAATA